jgi:VanZ family protein
VARWTIWTIFVVGWTIALEVPVPGRDTTIHGDAPLTWRAIIAKSTHVLAYAVLTVLSARLPLEARHRAMVMFFLMGHATATEGLQVLLQPYCHRGGTLADVGLDQLGIAIGVLISWKWWTRAP